MILFLIVTNILTLLLLIIVVALVIKSSLKNKRISDSILMDIAIQNEEAAVYYYTWIQLADRNLLTQEILDVYTNQRKESEIRKNMLCE